MEDPLIGLFGGTFDPIHFGHLNLALEIKEKCGLSEVWFIPSHTSPFKQDKNGQNAPLDRLEMVKRALEEVPGCFCLDIEVKRPPPSYTIETIEELEKEYPNKKFALILSDETYAHFSSWKEGEKIKKKVKILVGNRTATKGAVSTAVMEISSTEIRHRLKKKLYCGHLVPGKVLDFIDENNLYFIP
ncbi:MAG: Nicotinate-nucleotide adenylyltransferase [Chlamydiales bacterium]|nr:Nicotinate-nucleotide adenylyltransferase [Chlamydiales bacterium]MCH9619878.1 Nicotinate-nucleotide adenylyltransferase [Chlamydiales bacterium]MCH9622695.1 Nicotinate-nucleotide adenylyltransferase [Chlamydiales bacterium]